MRIACLHIPQFALQCLTRIDPSLRGAAVAVVGGGGVGGGAGASATGRSALFAPVVHACSRAAWGLGIRLGMTATAANATAGSIAGGSIAGGSIAGGSIAGGSALHVVAADAALERETVRALADAMLGVTATVDTGGRVGAGGAHLAMYFEVPAKTRGTTYGDRLLEVVETLGLTGRIGIADDRFTAWVAAAHGGIASEESGVVSVPRGGSAAFLAPMPLSLLAITPEVQHMLEALGVRTLGEFAALPAPSVARPLEADYQALARGDSGTGLRPYTPEAPIREAEVISASHTISAALAQLAARLALRLRGRARGASRLEVTATSASGDTLVPITARDSDPLTAMTAALGGRLHVLESAEAIADALTRGLTAALGDGLSTVWRLSIAVTAEAIAGDALGTPANGNMVASTSASAFASAPEPVDVLEVVLGTTGNLGTWQLTSPTGALRRERRDAHRRTRPSRAHRAPRSRELVQPRLFADRK